jgi:hypothetical protein
MSKSSQNFINTLGANPFITDPAFSRNILVTSRRKEKFPET